MRHWPIQVYDRPTAAWTPFTVAFETISLTAVNLPQTAAVAGGVLAVHLRWQGEYPAGRAGTAKVTLQLLDPDGRLAAQIDRPITAAELAGEIASYGLSVPLETRPGSYRLIVAVYDPTRPGGARLLAATGTDHVELNRVIIEGLTLRHSDS